MITDGMYENAIAALQNATRQLEPDGRNCAVCGDTDHQAFECHHNPLVLAAKYQALLESAVPLHELLHKLLPR